VRNNDSEKKEEEKRKRESDPRFFFVLFVLLLFWVQTLMSLNCFLCGFFLFSFLPHQSECFLVVAILLCVAGDAFQCGEGATERKTIGG